MDAKNPYGIAPVHAISFAFTITVYLPGSAVGKVTGSDLTIRNISEKSL